MNWSFEAQEYYGPDQFDDGTSERLYPKRQKDTLQPKDFYNAPSKVERLYRESVDCYNDDSLTLCAAGLRSIVEGICADRCVVDGPVQITERDRTSLGPAQKYLDRNIPSASSP